MVLQLTTSQLILTLVVVAATTFVIKLVQHRLAWRTLNLPGPPHSLLWGSLQHFGEARAEVARTYGPGVHIDYAADILAKKWGKGVVGLDTWPFALPMIIVTDGQLADSLLRVENMPKAIFMMFMDAPVVSNDSMVLAKHDPASHKQWSTLRKAFSPALAKGVLERNWTSDIVHECNVFVKGLEEAASMGTKASLNTLLNEVTVDIILRVMLSISDKDFRNKVLDLLNEQVASATNINLSAPMTSYLNPLYHWRNNRRDRLMENLLQENVSKHVADREEAMGKPKMDLVDELLQAGDFTVKQLISQTRTFLFAGSDTTGSTLAWVVYFLSVNPETLARIRAEHDEVFGKDTIGSEGELLSKDNSLINRLKYTLGAIRETLRLRPPASSARYPFQSDHTFSLNGQRYRSGPAYFWVCHYAMHMQPENFPNPEKFEPTRFLDENGDLAATPLTWQPFSRGPKNCVGLELAILEMRIILAMIVRKFDFVYTEAKEPYQVYRLTARPDNGIPMQVSLASR